MSDYNEFVRCTECSSLVHFTDQCPIVVARKKAAQDEYIKNFELEIKLVHELISRPPGFSIEICGNLCIRRLEDPRWVVSWEPHSKTELIFKNAIEAAEFFVGKRYDLELGLDFDEKAIKENKTSR